MLTKSPVPISTTLELASGVQETPLELFLITHQHLILKTLFLKTLCTLGKRHRVINLLLIRKLLPYVGCVCMCVCTCIYAYIYIHIHIHPSIW